MRGFWKILAATFLVSSAMLASGAAQAKKFEVLESFGGHTLGSNPQGPVLIDKDGNIFGTASQFGPQGDGTVFELKRVRHGYKASSIFRFNGGDTGASPAGALIMDTQGNLYGMAGSLAFELSPVAGQRIWSEKILYRFCSQQNCTDGNGPVGGLTYQGASGGTLYDGVSPLFGVTAEGGANNKGALFELTSNEGAWSESVLYSFCSQGGETCTDGMSPLGGLLMDSGGNLFGTTYLGGGKADGGIAFQLSPNGANWSYTLLYTFCSAVNCTDGANPDEPFVLDAEGNLLSTTSDGGAQCHFSGDNCGTIFQLSLVDGIWHETVLHSFCQQKDCKDGAAPAGLLIDNAGNLFGTTGLGGGHDTTDAPLGGGTVFELSGQSFQILHKFCSAVGCADGYGPEAGLVADSSGTLFGTTTYGGADADSNFGGTVFKVAP